MAIERERTYRLNFPTTPVFKGCWAPHEAEHEPSVGKCLRGAVSASPSNLRTTVGVSRLAGDASFWPAHCWAAIRRFDGTPDCIRGVAGISPCHGLPLHAGRACADQHQCRCRFSRHRAAPTTPRRGCQPLGLIRRTRCVKELRARLDRLTRRCCGEHLLHPLPLPLGSPRYRWGWVVLLRWVNCCPKCGMKSIPDAGIRQKRMVIFWD